MNTSIQEHYFKCQTSMIMSQKKPNMTPVLNLCEECRVGYIIYKTVEIRREQHLDSDGYSRKEIERHRDEAVL